MNIKIPHNSIKFVDKSQVYQWVFKWKRGFTNGIELKSTWTYCIDLTQRKNTIENAMEWSNKLNSMNKIGLI